MPARVLLDTVRVSLRAPSSGSRLPWSPWPRSLRLRLAVAVALSVGIACIAAAGFTWWQVTAEMNGVRGAAGRAAERAADRLARLPSPASDTAIAATLHGLDDASEIGPLTFVQENGDGRTVISTTATRPDEVGLATQAIRERRLVIADGAGEVLAATAVSRAGEPPAAVVARADGTSVAEARRRAFLVLLGMTVLSMLGLAALVDRAARPRLQAPLRQLRETIARVTAGDFKARVAIAQRDEIGEVAAGLNEMLARLEHFHDSLQARVDDATVELQQRNEELVESYHRLFGLREQLANAEQLASVGQTAANVAHQVGTPLNLISGYVQLLKEELGADTLHAARLAIIEEQIAKVTSTVRTLLDRSRQMGRKTRTEAGALVLRVCDVMRPNLAAAGITLQVETPGGDTPILVDATNLELALLNLMTNAVDAMSRGGTLGVVVGDAPGRRLHVSISDTGHGIPDDLLPRIFEPWVSTKKPGRGTGLGLAIARDVVAAHGGTISVESVVGRGTTFTIDLPSDAAREAGRAAS